MSSTGNVFPGTGENNAGIGATAWTNPGNIVSDNTTDAVCNAAASSQYLVARNFSFSIPAQAIIKGITVRVEASEHTAGTEGLNAQLQNDSAALVGSSKSATISGTGKAVYTYGSTSDVWGATLTPTIVNDADFGVRFWFTTAHEIQVDFVTLAVEFELPPIRRVFADGQSPAQIAGLVGFAGAAAIFSAAEFALPPPSADIPQPTLYGQAGRNLNQPSPVFSKLAEFTLPAKPPGKIIRTEPQAPDQPAARFFRQNPYSTLYQPSVAKVSVSPRHLDQPAPWFSKAPPAEAVRLLSGFHGTAPQVPGQGFVWFAEFTQPQNALVQAPFGFRFSGPQGQPEQAPSWFQGLTPDSVEPPEQPTPVLTGYGVSPRMLDQPAAKFSRQQLFTAPPPPDPTPNRPAKVLALLQSPEQPQPWVAGTQPYSVTDVLPAADISSIPNQQANNPSPWFSKIRIAAPAPQTPALRPHGFSGPQTDLRPIAALFVKVQQVSLTPPEPTKASISWAARNLDQPQPKFSHGIDFGAEPPPPPTIVPTKSAISWAVRNLYQPQPWFAGHPPPSVAAAVMPAAGFHPNWAQAVQQVQPTFAGMQPPSVEPPAPTLPPTGFLGQRSQFLDNIFPVWKRAFFPAEAPPPVTVQPTKPSIAWAARNLQQPQPHFSHLQHVEPKMPAAGFHPNWQQFQNPAQASFAHRFFPPAPPAPPALRGLHLGAQAQSPEQIQPAFSGQFFPPPPPQNTPNRPHKFAADQQSVVQPPAVFFHQPPESIEPPVGPPPGEYGGIPDPVRKRREEVKRPPQPKQAVQELREFLESPPDPEQLLLFEIPTLEIPPSDEDDIGALLMLGML